MKHLYLVLTVVGMMLLGACDSFVPEDAEFANLKGAPMVMNFRAHLSGDQEVPANESMATGEAVFQLSKDGMELSYKLIVANLDNIRVITSYSIHYTKLYERTLHRPFSALLDSLHGLR